MIRFLLSRRGAFRLLWLLLGGFIAFCSFDAFSSRLLPLLMKWRTDREKEKAIDDIAFRRRERERERERERRVVLMLLFLRMRVDVLILMFGRHTRKNTSIDLQIHCKPGNGQTWETTKRIPLNLMRGADG